MAIVLIFFTFFDWLQLVVTKWFPKTWRCCALMATFDMTTIFLIWGTSLQSLQRIVKGLQILSIRFINADRLPTCCHQSE